MKPRRYSPPVTALAEAVMPKPKKSCDGCTLCCRLIAVAEIGLPSFTRCQHERSFPYAGTPGCAVYDRRPQSCRVWSCQYLLEGWPDDLRPDRCGVVVDPAPDLMRIGGREVAACQMWVAAGFENAWMEDPVRALVLAAVTEVGHVLWRWKTPEGQLAMCFLKDENGQFGHTAPMPIDAAFTAEMSAAARMIRAEALLPPDQRLLPPK
jgi:hypothetical protein